MPRYVFEFRLLHVLALTDTEQTLSAYILVFSYTKWCWYFTECDLQQEGTQEGFVFPNLQVFIFLPQDFWPFVINSTVTYFSVCFLL